ncbi:hypothetical protein C8R43DRAFT_602831 [Mycena crocata]|nr:hypothetical protein C8R43DRAFT_602831 [Mycena crocata]
MSSVASLIPFHHPSFSHYQWLPLVSCFSSIHCCSLLPMPSIVTANLAGAFIEVFIYGGYITLFATVVYLFHSRHGISPDKRPVHWVLLGLVIQFLVVTAHWVNTIYRTFHAIVGLGAGSGAGAFYSNLSTPSSVVHVTLLVISTFVTDVLVIHRLYVIYSHNRRVVICPLVFLVGQAVCGVGIIYNFVIASPAEEFQILFSLSNAWVTTHLVLSILISAYSSGMIWWRIWRISRVVDTMAGRISGGMGLMSILAIIVESAGIQTTASVGILAAFQSAFVGQVVWSGCAPVILGISTLLIHARIGLGWAHEPEEQLKSTPTRIHFRAGNTAEEHELDSRTHK